MLLDKFYGNEKVLEFIENSIKNNNLSHSLLVTGEEGMGKKTFARFLTKAICCEKGVFFEECECSSCHKIEQGNHPDIKWYGVEEDTKKVKIDDIRDLNHWISLKPFESKTKVFIINNANAMTLESQNALLKTLEEPPDFSQIILLSSQKNVLLDTIRSRSIEVQLNPLSSETIHQVLEQRGIEEDIDILSRFTEGNLGKALAFAEEGVLEHNRFLLSDWLDQGAWGFLNEYGVKNREELKAIVELFIQFLRDYIVSTIEKENPPLIYPEEIQQFSARVGAVSRDSISQLIQDLMSSRETLEGNLNQKIAAEHIAIQLEDVLF